LATKIKPPHGGAGADTTGAAAAEITVPSWLGSAHAEQLAASSGFSEIKLYTNKLFAENVRLYSKLGYGVDREEEFKGAPPIRQTARTAARPSRPDASLRA
jgi:hypothetical protein